MAGAQPVLPEYEVDLPPEEITRWVEAELDRGVPLNFDVLCVEHYTAEEDFDRVAYDLDDGADYDLVSAHGRLSVEPHVERNYWILQVRVRRVFGPMHKDREPFEAGPMEVSEFRRRFLSHAEAERHVVVSFETSAARRHFEDWIAEMKNRHGLDTPKATATISGAPRGP